MADPGNGRIDVDALLAATDLVAVVGHYVPLKKRGAEYVGRCVWHSPDEHPSMSVVPAKRMVYCHACGEGGDAIAFLQQVEGVDFRTACERLNGHAPVWTPMVSESNAERARRERTSVPRETGIPPADAPTPAMRTRELGEPLETRPIRALDGALLGYECRYPRDAEGKSASRVWTWGRRGTGPWGWGCGVFSRPRPLYGLDRLGHRPEAPVVVTEGPKKADAAGQLLPTYACVSWTGGANAWHTHDWEPLRGRVALLWPDADWVGVEAMDKLAAHLQLGMGCPVRVLDPTGQPEGWDAADAMAEGWDTERLRAWSKGKVRVWQPVQPTEPVQDAPEARSEARGGVSEGGAATPVATPAAPKPRKPRLAVVDGGAAVRAPQAGEDGEPLPVPLSDAALGDYFVETYGGDWRYVKLWDQWFRWEGDTWLPDERSYVKHVAMSVVRAAAYWPEALTLTSEAKRKLSSVGKGGSLLSVAMINPAVAAGTDQWDTDPMLLGVPGGVVDLRTGELHPGRREDYIRMQAAVAPSVGPSPQWDAFLARVQPDPVVRDYLRRFAGYCLTGLTREHVLMFSYGGGANGKSTFISTLSGILGDYATAAGMETFSEGLHGHTSEIARLAGKRLVSAEETGSGTRWDEARINQLTGGTAVTACFKRQDEFSFVPALKLMFAGNHMPKLKAVTEGIRRRLNLVPWSVQIPERERDVSLLDKLKEEWPMILRWAIEGCLEYQRIGLAVPKVVVDAGADYLEDEDSVRSWRIAATEDAPRERVQSSDLYRSYRIWCEAQEEKPMGQRAFVEALTQSGCSRVKSNGVRYVGGIRLRPMEERLQDAPGRSGKDWD